jgi:hypothetical protein
MRARRAVVREFLLKERVSLLCLVETKLDVMSASMANDLMGTRFDYVCLPSLSAQGGIVVAWDRAYWAVFSRACHNLSFSICVAPSDAPSSSWTSFAHCGQGAPAAADLWGLQPHLPSVGQKQ